MNETPEAQSVSADMREDFDHEHAMDGLPQRDDAYNGWTNYPTWAVNLWLSNEEGLYREALERTAETIADPTHVSDYWTAEQTARFNVADMLKDWVAELAGDTYEEPTMVADLIGYALGEVDWHEIADAWIEHVKDGQL